MELISGSHGGDAGDASGVCVCSGYIAGVDASGYFSMNEGFSNNSSDSVADE